jgi:hypothetical protein
MVKLALLAVVGLASVAHGQSCDCLRLDADFGRLQAEVTHSFSATLSGGVAATSAFAAAYAGAIRVSGGSCLTNVPGMLDVDGQLDIQPVGVTATAYAEVSRLLGCTIADRVYGSASATLLEASATAVRWELAMGSGSNIGFYTPQNFDCSTTPTGSIEVGFASTDFVARYDGPKNVETMTIQTSAILSAVAKRCSAGIPSGTGPALSRPVGTFFRVSLVSGTSTVVRDAIVTNSGVLTGPGVSATSGGFSLSGGTGVTELNGRVVAITSELYSGNSGVIYSQLSLEPFDAAFGTSLGSSAYDIRADFNLDGVVDGSDYAALAANLASTRACLADINGDGTVDGTDFIAFMNAFSVGSFVADVGAVGVAPDGTVDGADYLEFINAFSAGC